MSKTSGIQNWEAFPNIGKINLQVDKLIIDTLRGIGEYALSKAPELHVFDNYTYNLEDSYAFAIYKDGEIVYGPQHNKQKAHTPNPDEFGRDESFNYLNDLNPGEGYVLVVAAKTDYAEKVENLYEGDVLISLEFATVNKAEGDFSSLDWRIYG